jgi:hypothetical protein
MTLVGVMRIKYSDQVELRPSRFVDVAAYTEWCERADAWAGVQNV